MRSLLRGVSQVRTNICWFWDLDWLPGLLCRSASGTCVLRNRAALRRRPFLEMSWGSRLSPVTMPGPQRRTEVLPLLSPAIDLFLQVALNVEAHGHTILGSMCVSMGDERSSCFQGEHRPLLLFQRPKEASINMSAPTPRTCRNTLRGDLRGRVPAADGPSNAP